MPAIQHVLLPTDFSETSNAALQHAVDLARAFGARLYLLHVPGKTGENFEANFPIGRFEDLAREGLAALLSPDEIERLQPEYAWRIGTPADEIVRYADARNIDVIVMGTHGRSGIAHVLLGSVAEQVIRAATCPVFLVRSPRPASTMVQLQPADVEAPAPIAII